MQPEIKPADLKKVKKSKIHSIVKLSQYHPDVISSTIILQKTTGNVTASSFTIGQEWPHRTALFDQYILIIDGFASLLIDAEKYCLHAGEGIIIPAHTAHSFLAIAQFKMIATTLKNGFTD